MRYRLRAMGLVTGLALSIFLVAGETARGETPTLETVVFADPSKDAPSCCPIPSIPVEAAAQAAVKDLPEIIRISVDETRGKVAVTFDPARVGRARIIAALAWYGLELLDERR